MNDVFRTVDLYASYLPLLLLDIKASLWQLQAPSCSVQVLMMMLKSFWRSWILCCGNPVVFFADFRCFFHVCGPQALFNMDHTGEYGICSCLSAGRRYGDMRKAVWPESYLVLGCLQGCSYIATWGWMLLWDLCHKAPLCMDKQHPVLPTCNPGTEIWKSLQAMLASVWADVQIALAWILLSSWTEHQVRHQCANRGGFQAEQVLSG